MAALAAVKSFKRLAGSRQQGLTYEVEVVAQHAGRQGRRHWRHCFLAAATVAPMPALTLAHLPFHAAELPLPPGSQAIFVLKRRHRLCVTEAAEVDGGGGVEWDTRCTQASERQLWHRFQHSGV